jgi:hypothetical protein
VFQLGEQVAHMLVAAEEEQRFSLGEGAGKERVMRFMP